MFNTLGQFIARYWLFVLAFWLLLFLLVKSLAPPFQSVATSGEFKFLPKDSPSLIAEELFHEKFDKDFIGSLIAIVVSRENRLGGLITDGELKERKKDDGKLSDIGFIENVLKPKIVAIVNPSEIYDEQASEPIVRTENDRHWGKLLQSDDKQASLITVELPTDFLDSQNTALIEKIEDLIFNDKSLNEKMIPGLNLSISGSATVNRDVQVARSISLQSTKTFALVFVVILVIAIYRAPFLALLPLVTGVIASEVAIGLVSGLASMKLINIFSDLEIYITVVTYGAGIGYCLLLISRYKEEIDSGATIEDGILNAIPKVGPPLLASAAASIVGTAMMIFSNFEKFRQAGIGISIGLFFAFLASVTLAPALLRFLGRWVFWPSLRTERVGKKTGWLDSEAPLIGWKDFDWLTTFWDNIGESIKKFPATILFSTIAIMTPFAILGIALFNYLSYSLTDELPAESNSVIGTNVVQNHFPAGTSGPTTILLRNSFIDFTDEQPQEQIRILTEKLQRRHNELKLAEIRSISHPLGVTAPAVAKLEEIRKDIENNSGSTPAQIMWQGLLNKRILKQYVGKETLDKNDVTRIDVIFEDDPYSRDNIKLINSLEDAVKQELPEDLKDETELFFLGTTANIRDLKNVTDHDQLWISIFVIVGVYIIVVALLRKPGNALYLVFSCLLSYFVTLGITFAFFWAMNPTGFEGLDWKVRFFLFTILFSIGQTYNIFLVSRIEEESKSHGSIEGTINALVKTGTILSSCGIIMAGSFAALLTGSLTGMIQLGFALAIGVILNTFIVRTILVPCYKLLINRGKFGSLGQLLGAAPSSPERLET